MADSSLAAIQTKVRRLTRTPSENQLSDADLDEYINTFVLYDFPEHVRLFNLRDVFTFYTQPFIDTYQTNSLVPSPTNQFSNFLNNKITLEEPAYCAGYRLLFSQSREQFFNIYPLINNIASVATGDGITTNFVGTLTGAPVLRNNVTFGSIDANNNGLVLYDDGNGNLIGNGNGTINYVTGAFVLNYATPPGSGTAITGETSVYTPARPQSMLFFDGRITLRPVPDIPYQVTVEAYIQPTELLASNQSPDLQEWWQYIAYGAAKKIFEDRMDQESVAMIMPEFKQQERLLLRRTIVQQTNDRVATIYTEQAGGPSAYGWNFSGPF